jgi:hypothetical protein
MAELLAKKKETKLLLSITNGRLGYLEINEDKMRFKDAMKGGKAIGGNEGMTQRMMQLGDSVGIVAVRAVVTAW